MKTEKRKIKVRLFVKVWGEEYSKVIEIDSPLVSNQPCMNIQAQTDNHRAAAAALFCIRQGYEVLSAQRTISRGFSR